ncbi:MAG TPA: cytochrome c [Vicinamibacterales bacterium]
MKLRFLFGTLAVIWLAGVTQFSAEQSKSVWDGVFTKEQADRGAAAYKSACSECHGGDLAGDGFAPALSGPDFMGNWNDLSVGDLFERVRISMPPSAPSSVTPAQKADILAHLMNANKFPVGKVELEPKTEALKDIKIELKK